MHGDSPNKPVLFISASCLNTAVTLKGTSWVVDKPDLALFLVIVDIICMCTVSFFINMIIHMAKDFAY